MFKSSVIIGTIVVLLLISSVSNLFASGIRGDSGEGASDEEHMCWVLGYDSGFAGKYDADKAEECSKNDEPSHDYVSTWNTGCEDALRTDAECREIINNPVEIENWKALVAENNSACYEAGREDGKANRPFNEERENGCYEFESTHGGYEGGYQVGCEEHTVESACELKYEKKNEYCPEHPDVGACTEFLHNANNKIPESFSPYDLCAGAGDPRPDVICQQEINPEKYCLKHDNSYCKFIGDLCDDEGFVRPEYPYCNVQVK